MKVSAMLVASAILGMLAPAGAVSAAPAEDDKIVIMIDPGHGGSNLGGQYNALDEKNLTLITAAAMKEELEKYEGVEVHLTRNADIDLSLAERAQLAENVEADFLISLHYNMSAEHNLYGAEVWIPSAGENYVKGYALGNLMLDEFDTYGLFRRGVKTRVGTRGDYYGVIRESTKRGIPSMIVEHCHLDHPVDQPVYNSIPQLQAFGRSDATAVAKYFGLSSKELDVNYADYPKLTVAAPKTPVMQDTTPPEKALVTIAYDERKDGGMLGVCIEGEDAQSGIFYYSYSLDGGATWSMLSTMPAGTKSVTIECNPSELIPDKRIVARLYNGYDRMTETEPVAYE